MKKKIITFASLAVAILVYSLLVFVKSINGAIIESFNNNKWISENFASFYNWDNHYVIHALFIIVALAVLCFQIANFKEVDDTNMKALEVNQQTTVKFESKKPVMVVVEEKEKN